ncbi:hypothetical protein BKA70DRAFT_79899 [Coprinopsis sp. MPI-PUGE-AT-0042]|nr:hypothetical protein BKA70DRAFT_79899 [Coprinopsis sp. MPI-PUGE-AT-0042]
MKTSGLLSLILDLTSLVDTSPKLKSQIPEPLPLPADLRISAIQLHSLPQSIKPCPMPTAQGRRSSSVPAVGAHIHLLWSILTVRAGATSGLTTYTTSTWYSFPYNDHPSLGLVNRALRAFDKLGNWGTNVTIVRSGEKLVWSRSLMYPNPEDNSRVYSAVKDPSNEYPILAAYDISSLWSLCPDARFRGQTQLVFNVSAVTPPPLYLSFDPYLCYDVTVNLVPA